jgi:hypothetical protein
LWAGPTLHSEEELRNALAELQPRIPVFAVEQLPQFDGIVTAYPSAKILAQVAAEANRTFVLPPLEPMYLREPHITIPKRR